MFPEEKAKEHRGEDFQTEALVDRGSGCRRPLIHQKTVPEPGVGEGLDKVRRLSSGYKLRYRPSRHWRGLEPPTPPPTGQDKPLDTLYLTHDGRVVRGHVAKARPLSHHLGVSQTWEHLDGVDRQLLQGLEGGAVAVRRVRVNAAAYYHLTPVGLVYSRRFDFASCGSASMSDRDIALMAHLLRRAGFGATRNELEQYMTKGYEATVEELLHPGDPHNIPDDILYRYHENFIAYDAESSSHTAYWLYRMISSECPMEEKIALFWHGVLPTNNLKANDPRSLLNQIDMFRRHGLGRFDDLLLELSKDPAMLIFLDNNDNHTGAINENYGRELLELFSMGIGNYTEQDIKECARAFTGWTLGNVDYMSMRLLRNSFFPYGFISWHFDYKEEDHDDEKKTFLGETGGFNGEDIIDIICRQPATARFVARHLYDFFVADEAPVPQWPYTPPRDSEAIETLAAAYMESDHDIRSVLRVLFNSDFFKSDEVRFGRVKGPAELVVGTLRLRGGVTRPTLDMIEFGDMTAYMGQTLMDPPSVEGWHEGTEWINSGALVERVNFAAKQLADVEKPGVRSIVERLATYDGGRFSPEELVDSCLDILGPIPASDETRSTLVEHASRQGDLSLKGHQRGDNGEQRVGELLGLIASMREFQLA